MVRPYLALNAFRAFEASARHLSFTRAAIELNVTQAAVSHQVKHLETALKVSLFRRLPRGLMVTEEGLALRRKRPWRHATAVHREQRRPAAARNDIWSMDFVADALFDGRRFRSLTIVDNFTKVSLAIEVGQQLKGGLAHAAEGVGR